MYWVWWLKNVCVVIFVQAMFGLLLAFALKGFGRVPQIQPLFDKCESGKKWDPESNKIAMLKVV